MSGDRARPTTSPARSGVNVALLRRTLEHITARPAEHDQRFWAMRHTCGTTLCLAGHAVLLAGHHIDWDGDGLAAGGYHVRDGRTIPDVAQTELGLTCHQAEAFYDNASIGELWAWAAEITDGEILWAWVAEITDGEIHAPPGVAS